MKIRGRYPSRMKPVVVRQRPAHPVQSVVTTRQRAVCSLGAVIRVVVVLWVVVVVEALAATVV